MNAVLARQIVLLAISVSVPALLILFNKPRHLVGWCCFTLFTEVFDTTIFTNLPAGRVVGLVYLPVAIVAARDWLKLTPARAWLVNFIYLIGLGVLFGFVFPWPDSTGGFRPFNLMPQGRTIVYLVRVLSDFSVTILVVRALRDPSDTRIVTKWLTYGAAVTGAAGVVGYLLNIDFYLLITGLREYATRDFRERGLSFEPRGLGLSCAYGLTLLLIKPRRTQKDWLVMIPIAGGLLFSFSTSGLACFAVGVALVFCFGSGRNRIALATAAIALLLMLTIIAVVRPALFGDATHEISSRLEGRGTTEANDPPNMAEAIALRLDVFDASAALFLVRNPRYIFIGTGPGLVSLPASFHVPKGIYTVVWPNGIDSLPTHGLLHELANSGVIGIVTWLIGVWSSMKALNYFAAHDHRRGPYREARLVFIVGMVFFLLQISPSPIWAVFRGVGWHAVAARLRGRRPAAVQAAIPELGSAAPG